MGTGSDRSSSKNKSTSNDQGHNGNGEARLIVTSDAARQDKPLFSAALDSAALALEPGVTEVDYANALQAATDIDASGLSVYIHLPFCPSRCLTCDHHTSVSHDHRQIDHYLDALEREVTIVTSHLGNRRRLQQLHLGGGTPNYLTEVQLVRLIDILDRHFLIDDETDTSLEANAHRASVSQLALLHGLGFRSLNLEIRDLDPAVQQALGRHQSFGVIRDVIETARSIGFENISTDLVHGLPMQNTSSIVRTVDQLLELGPDRIACYNYSRRPNVFQHQLAVDERQMPSLADRLSMFSRIVEGLCDSGYEWIWLDCFAKESDALSQAQRAGHLHRNRIGYTAKSGRTLLGFGSSSVTDLNTLCVRNHAGIEEWKLSLEAGHLPVVGGAQISPQLRYRREALSDLMCNLRIDDSEHRLHGGNEEDQALRALREEGLLDIDGSHVSITEAGRYALHQLWGDASPTHRWSHIA